MTTCPHLNTYLSLAGEPLRWMCTDCNREVKPNGFVLVEQPLPDELALMDFAAAVTRREA